MSTWYGPKTTVIDVRVLKREPKSYDVGWLGVQERTVLVTCYFATDVRLLKDVHGLEQQRLVDS